MCLIQSARRNTREFSRNWCCSIWRSRCARLNSSIASSSPHALVCRSLLTSSKNITVTGRYFSGLAVSMRRASPEKYLPVTVMFFDDVNNERHTSACGELLAIDEFNRAHRLRQIEQHQFLENSRVFRRADWIKHIYYLHVLDHPHRSTRSREALPKVWIENPYLKPPAIPPLQVPRGRPSSPPPPRPPS